jgi:hypothetical protein
MSRDTVRPVARYRPGRMPQRCAAGWISAFAGDIASKATSRYESDMPVHYQVDAARQRIESVAIGPVTHAEIVTHLDRERTDGVLGLPEFVDATQATAAFSSDEVHRLLERLRILRRNGELGPAAVLVANELSYGMLRMLEILTAGVCDVRPFRDRTAAESWLESQAAPQEQ